MVWSADLILCICLVFTIVGHVYFVKSEARKKQKRKVACPGTLHLPDRNPVYLVICVFGRFQKTQHVYPSFPMVFNSRIKFQRIFTNAKTPDHVLEILEDETMLIELRQHCKGYKGGRVLASYEESARKFLFPSQSYIPKEDHLKRDILLARTEYFPSGKALDPQLVFRTKTSIEEAPAVLFSTPDHLSISKQIPPSSHSKHRYSSISSSKKKSHSKKKNLNKSSSATPYRDHHYSSDDLNNDVEYILAKRSNKSSSHHKHCICECPVLSDEQFQLDAWIDSLSLKQDKIKTPVKPFRTGKAPENLMAKRTFLSPSKTENQIYKIALCNHCLLPSRSCVLCNAYKNVYGADSFLRHRFERYHKEKSSAHTETKQNADLSLGEANLSQHYRHTSKSKHSRTKSNPNAVFQKSPTHDDNKIKSIEFYTPYRSIIKHYTPSSMPMVPTYRHHPSSSDDESIQETNTIHRYRSHLTPRSYVRPRSPSSTDDEIRRSTFVPSPRTSPRVRSKLFKGNKTMHRSVEDIEKDESFLKESSRIHQRIKDLMKKNNSVLQHDLSSSDSITDDESDDYAVQQTFKSPARVESISWRRNLPSQSVVVPLGGGKFWSSNKDNHLEDRSPRDVFDSSLKSIYEDMYEKTLNSKRR